MLICSDLTNGRVSQDPYLYVLRQHHQHHHQHHHHYHQYNHNNIYILHYSVVGSYFIVNPMLMKSNTQDSYTYDYDNLDKDVPAGMYYSL